MAHTPSVLGRLKERQKTSGAGIYAALLAAPSIAGVRVFKTWAKHGGVLNVGKEKPPEPGRSPEFQRFLGGAEGTRTPDPLHAMQVRYQLRHSPEFSLLRHPSASLRSGLCPDLSEATQIS